MVITLSGDNGFGLAKELRKLTADFVKKHGDLALERLDGQEADLEQMRQAVQALPLLASHKMVVLRNPGVNKQFAEQAEQILGGAPETTDVIVVEPKLDKRLAYYKFLTKKTDFRDFAALDQNGLAGWLVRAAKQQGGSLSPADARYLVERIGTNQQLLGNELDKLLLYNPAISRQSIDALTEPAPQSTIFQLLEAAFAGNSRRALQLYTEQRALKVEPPQIIAMLAWQLQVLAIIKTAGQRSADEIAREARLNPFVVRKSQAIARQRELSRLKELINDLLSIDLRSKRTAIDADEALQHYLLTLAT